MYLFLSKQEPRFSVTFVFRIWHEFCKINKLGHSIADVQLLLDRLSTKKNENIRNNDVTKCKEHRRGMNLCNQDAFAVVLHGCEKVKVSPHLIVILESWKDKLEVLHVRNLVLQPLKSTINSHSKVLPK